MLMLHTGMLIGKALKKGFICIVSDIPHLIRTTGNCLKNPCASRYME